MVNGFTDEYKFLANNCPCKFTFEGLEYSNVDAAWIASKFLNPKTKRKIAKLSSVEARKKRNLGDNPDWEENKDKILEEILRSKFSNPELLQKLKNTSGELNNIVKHNDPVYGIYLGKGENRLGKILMKIRDN